jgi:hypothetical protein
MQGAQILQISGPITEYIRVSWLLTWVIENETC